MSDYYLKCVLSIACSQCLLKTLLYNDKKESNVSKTIKKNIEKT